MSESPLLKITDIATNQSQKEVTHNQAVAALEIAITSHLAKSVAGGTDVTLTDSGSTPESRNAILELTGLITANINVIVPNRDKEYRIHNNTTGAFTITVKTAAGSGVIVEQNSKKLVYCDGTNVVEGVLPAYRSLTANATLRITDELVFVDATGGNVTLTLPAASTFIGKSMRIVRIDSSANTVTVQRAGADDINNAATSKTITNTIGTALTIQGGTSTRFFAQTGTAA